MLVKKGNVEFVMSGAELHINLMKDNAGNLCLTGALFNSKSKEIYQIIRQPIEAEPIDDVYQNTEIDGESLTTMPSRKNTFVIHGLTVLQNVDFFNKESLHHT